MMPSQPSKRMLEDHGAVAAVVLFAGDAIVGATQRGRQPLSNDGASLSAALILVNLVAASRLLSRAPGEAILVRLKVLGAATFCLSFLLCSAASVHAQDGHSSFLTWLHHVARTGAHRRAASSPPLPRSRPAELAPAPITSRKTSAGIPNSRTSRGSAASMEGDEVPKPAAVAPATAETSSTETSSSKPQPATSSAGDEVPTSAIAPDAAEPGGSDEAPANPAAPAPAAAVSPAAAPAMTDANAPVADQLRGVLQDDKARTAFEAFYSARNYAPLWITDGKVNDRAKAAIDYLAHVDADGLDPADYPVPDFTSLTDPAALAEAEVKLSAAATAYAHHAQVGRVHWTRVSGDIFYDLKPSAPADVLANLAGANDVAAALAAYEPQTPGYLALKAKLAELRADISGGKAPILDGPVLKVAMPLDTIIANMERWRWMPHDLGKTYVMVNLPEFMLYVVHNGRQVWATKIVVGKPETPTPIMTAEMKSITINPTWNIPDTIAAREYVPLMRQDPTILERMGLNVSYNRDNTIHISQPPGPNNALGQLRFNFPNKFFVYQHDLNEKYLFAKPMRDSSHGCMRVQDPVKYAEVLLAIARPREGYTGDRIRGMFGTAEIEVRLPVFIPVHVTYQTAIVDKDSKLQFREDIYGRDRALLAILKSDERKVADIPIERKDNVVRREALAMPDQVWGWGGQNIFARLFGFPAAQSGHRRRSVTERVR